jgi:hypothetical protein
MALPNRMSLRPGLLWLTLNLALIVQRLSWNNIYSFFNFTYPLRCLRVPQVEYHWLRWRVNNSCAWRKQTDYTVPVSPRHPALSLPGVSLQLIERCCQQLSLCISNECITLNCELKGRGRWRRLLPSLRHHPGTSIQRLLAVTKYLGRVRCPRRMSNRKEYRPSWFPSAFFFQVNATTMTSSHIPKCYPPRTIMFLRHATLYNIRSWISVVELTKTKECAHAIANVSSTIIWIYKYKR